jgi:beta-phosphoglucomutase-like phosphatase (HAD superfamily)
MDGTLVDTEPYWMEEELALAERYGGTWTHDQALQVVGFDLLVAARLMRTQMGIDLAPERMVEELLDGVIARVQRAVPWRAGARELLASLRTVDVPCALVTMSYARFVEPIVAALPSGTFDVVITGDAVDRGKPHPEPYLAAARALDVRAGDCLAIEGCVVLVAPLHVTVPAGERRLFVDSLEGLDAGSVLGGLAVG